MAEHKRFHYRSLAELTTEVEALGLDLPAQTDLSVLWSPARLGRLSLPNRLAVHPMEGCDGTETGEPTDLTYRRYERFAAGGAGLIWMEATAVVPAGRANPRQLWLHEGSLPAMAALAARTRAAAEAAGTRPVLVLQLTHSGRYSRPVGRSAPIIAHHSPVLDGVHNLGPDYPLISDEELAALQDAYARAAVLAAEAGFDAVDIKACHRYLLNELLASHTRTGRFGGAFANRARMLLETVAKVKAAVGERLEITCRLNVYDGLAWPYGWGVAAENGLADAGETARLSSPKSPATHTAETAVPPIPQPDLAEPLELIAQLVQAGLSGLSVTAGNPYWRPHVNRPADWVAANDPPPAEHPLEGVGRLVRLTAQVQQRFPQLTVVGAGYTWLRQHFPNFAAAAVAKGWVSVAGLGRGALAYPDFAIDIRQRGGLDRRKVCIVCGSCTQIMRDGGRAGCVVRDAAVYGPIFKAGRRGARDSLKALASQCRLCADPPCQQACPAGLDIPAFLAAVAAGDEQAAYAILRQAMLLPASCGAVCPAEVQCRGACVRKLLDEPDVPTNQVHQHVALRAIEAGWAALRVPEEGSGKAVAVVGAGPAGLACAAELLAAGHSVTVFDRAAQAGGKLTSVIPASRLERQLVQKEIAAIFGGVRADRLAWRFGVGLGAELSLEQLLGRGFSAVCLAFGLGESASLGGQRCPGVVEANEFLARMNGDAGLRVSGDVAVIGGGNTAVDAAVMARQRGAQDVYILYRRGYGQMPAWPAQRLEALEGGIHLLLLTQADGYAMDASGRACGVRTVRTRLGEPDASGRRRAVAMPASQAVLPAAVVIEALGDEPNQAANALEGVRVEDGVIVVNPDNCETSRKGVFAAGDAVNGGATVVAALAEGKRAGRAIGRCLEAL